MTTDIDAILLILVVIVGYMIYQNSMGTENMKLVDSKTTSSAPMNNPNVVPAVGNVFNRDKAWNDTPTEGMLRGIKGTIAPRNEEGESSPTPVPGGIPVTEDNYCHVPTGYLGSIVKAWESGKRYGLISMDGMVVDMGQYGGNQFYDTDGSGCCDTYCRRVVKGGYWSCVGPNTVTSQYEAKKPTGTPCMHYGRNRDSKLSPLY